MDNGLGCESLRMPALSNDQNAKTSTNGTTTSSSELFCQINDPEDVGAIVTSFCKVIQDGYGQIKKEIVTENEAVLGSSSTNFFSYPNHTVNDVIKDDSQVNGSDVVQHDTHEENEIKEEELNDEEIDNSLKTHEDSLQCMNDESNLEPKDIIVSIKDANEDSTSRSSSEAEEEDEDDEEEKVEIDKDVEKVDQDDKKDAIPIAKLEEKESPFLRRSRRGSVLEAQIKPELKHSVSEDISEDVTEEEIDDDEPEELSDDQDEESEEEEEEEPAITKATLRARKKNEIKDKAAKQRELTRQISIILKKKENDDELTKSEETLLRKHPKVFDEVSRRHKRRKTTEMRKQEIEDSPSVLAKKCDRMAKAIQKAKYLIVYTGAGISTAANIPDYRGPNGVWTCMDQGRAIQTCDLAQAEPTYTHMALFTLFKKGKLKHIVSQNCDGLHLRSGIPRYALSEVHGNMFIEVCKQCKPMRPYLRLFDVTERTSKNKHNTMRRCHVCGNSLIDTIVHFGERGSIKWPINWDGASKAAEKADVIICFGSSLKVLRRYPWLWCMDRPKKHRPKLYIVNLQWTPKDSAATCKLNGRCDDVMRRVMAHLDIEVPAYYSGNDPLLTYATPLHANEEHTTTREELIGSSKEGNDDDESSKDSHASEVKSWSLDHAYLPNDVNNSASSKSKSKGKLVKSKKLDYRNIMWPRDALYISYKEEKFEYVTDLEAQDEAVYYCDCCDPSRQVKKRGHSESEDEDSEDDDEADEDDEAEDDDKTSTTSSLETKTEANNSGSSVPTSKTSSEATTPTNTPLQPGWFGKGRRKRARC